MGQQVPLCEIPRRNVRFCLTLRNSTSFLPNETTLISDTPLFALSRMR